MYAELNERLEAATSSYSETGEFLRYIYSVLVVKNQSRCLVHEFSFTDIFFKSRFIWLWLLIAIMKRCAERCALHLYRTSLSIFYSFSAAELNNLESEDEEKYLEKYLSKKLFQNF